MRQRTVRVVAAIVGFLMAAGVGLAQQSGRGGVFGDEPTISFEFQGGSAVLYVKAVQGASDQKRVVVMPGCSEYVMPAVELRDVTVGGALAPLKHAWSSNPVNWMPLQVTEEQGVYVVAPSWEEEPQEKIETQVWSLAEMLEAGAVRSEDVLTAVETALEMESAKQKAEVRYHPETRLLIVRGSNPARQAVDRVLSGVWDSSKSLRGSTEAEERINAELDKLRVELDAASKLLEEQARFAENIEEQFNNGAWSEPDLLDARKALIQAEARRAEIEFRIRSLTQQRDRLSGENSGSGGGGAR